MLTSMPETVRQAWGEPVARDFTTWLEESLVTQTVNRNEWVQTTVRLGTIEHDVADIKVELRELRGETNERFDRMSAQFNERFDRMTAQFDARFDSMNERFDRMTAQFDARFDGMNERFDRLQAQTASQMRWSIGLLAVFGTLIAILVGIGQLAPLFLP